jgi:hypothetical protein
MSLNAREIASLVWLAVLLAWVLTQPPVRASGTALIRVLVNWKVLLPLAAFALYVVALIAAARRVGLWEASMTKDSIAWLVLVGLGIVLSSNRAASERAFIRDAVRRAIGISAFLEFYMNLVVFDLAVELVLQPTVVVLSLVSVYGHSKREFAPTAKVTDSLLGIIGLALFASVTVQVVREWSELNGGQLLLDLLLPVWLTIGSLPFVFLFALVMSYETAFLRLRFASSGRKLGTRTWLALLLGLHFRLGAVHSFGGAWLSRLAEAPTVSESLRVVREYLRSRIGNAQTTDVRFRPMRFAMVLIAVVLALGTLATLIAYLGGSAEAHRLVDAVAPFGVQLWPMVVPLIGVMIGAFVASRQQTRAQRFQLVEAKLQRLRAAFQPVLLTAWALSDATSPWTTQPQEQEQTARATMIAEAMTGLNQARAQLALETEASELNETFQKLYTAYSMWALTRSDTNAGDVPPEGQRLSDRRAEVLELTKNIEEQMRATLARIERESP